jgi:hypothetical protein
MRNFNVVFLIALAMAVIACMESVDSLVPNEIGEKARLRAISGEEAAQVIDKLHDLEVAATKNVIAYYDDKNEDILYLTWYESAEMAAEDLKTMIDKMSSNEDSPFYHLMPLSSYDDKVYMTIGMGAIHYIYLSGKRMLWYQTHQSFGMELPESLLSMYPVE